MLFSTFSESPKEIPPLTANKVQIWRVGLAQDQKTIEKMTELLFADERERANRFHFPHLRMHYIAARSALRIVAGALTGRANHRVRFAYTQHDKPYLPESDLSFNISHTHEIALLAFTRRRAIGIDIEYIRTTIDAEQIARRFFSPSEISDYLSVPAVDRPQAFYNCWTRKEAYIKAIGDGLTFPLDQFTVTLKPGDPAQLLDVQSNPEEAQRWKMIAIHPGENYTGALIAEGQEWQVQGWDFQFPKSLE